MFHDCKAIRIFMESGAVKGSLEVKCRTNLGVVNLDNLQRHNSYMLRVKD